jgi:5-methylcytosine-specific restriction endonuclease McrA
MNTVKTITRGEAKSQGLKRYRTGKQCKHWHLAERSVLNGGCVACAAALRATSERIAAQRAYGAAYNATAKGRATQRARNAARYATPAGKDAKRASSARSRGKLLGLLCSCCDPGDFLQTYMEAALMADHEVDHRVPHSQGGLHCVHNLQILTKTAHRQKTTGETAKLTEALVLKIVASGESGRVLAGRFWISPGAVSDIKNGHSWGHLTGVSRGATQRLA